jgi:Mce-associated membrane protein
VTSPSESSSSPTAPSTPEDAEDAAPVDEGVDGAVPRRRRVGRVLTYFVLPVITLGVAAGGGYTKYLLVQDAVTKAHTDSVSVAKDVTVSMLSYTPENAATTLTAARDRLTGALRDSYSSLITDVVIAGAEQKHISATATVAAAASVSATSDHAVVLVFVNQSVIQGQSAPTGTASTVKITLERSGTQWLASGFDPI